MHKFGFFREETMLKVVSFELEEAISGILKKIRQGGGHEAVLKVYHMFEIHTLNIVYQVVVGKRFQTGDPIGQKLLSAINASNSEFDSGTSILDVLPWLRYLPFFKFYKNTVQFNRILKDHFRKELIEPRRKTGSYRTNPVDFADHFLLEIDNRAEESPCYLSETNFLACVRDLMSGATDTTNAALEHGILHVCLQPEIQTKVQEEIDRVIGATREPCYEDRKSMPYTQAVLWEILRYSTLVAIVSRCPLTDGEIYGSTIPKDSLVGINIYAMHHSKEMWSDLDDFRPERFLNEKTNELINLDKIMPFGHGKRICPGEFSAKISFFLFLVSLLQKFRFELPKSYPPPSLKNKKGVSHGPFPFYVQISERRPAQKSSVGENVEAPAC